MGSYLPAFEATLKAGSRGTLRSSIWRTFSHNEGKSMILKLTADICSYVPPLCITLIVEYAQDPTTLGDRIFIVAAAMLVAPAIMGLCNHWWYYFVMLDGLHARSTIQAAVYSKVLRISNAARTKSTADGGVADTIINLQSTDCRQIEMCYWMWNYVWAAPLQVVVTTVLLYMQLGWPVFLGIAILLLLIPLQKSCIC